MYNDLNINNRTTHIISTNMKAIRLLLPMIAIFLLAGCQASKQVVYFQNIDSISLEGSRGLYDARIMPKDMLTITVSTTDPDASRPFNLAVGSTVGAGGQLGASSNLQGYLVDNSGNINFPIIGKMHVQGMTKEECQNAIAERIAPYMAKTENPIVTVRMASYRVTVIGEVNGPTVVPVTTEKMSIVEALASVGDMSIYGKRKNVLLIREDETGQKHKVRLDLTDANIFNSPYYYLQQNDIIYVEPSSVKTKGADLGPTTTMWFSFISIATSLAALIVNVLRN